MMQGASLGPYRIIEHVGRCGMATSTARIPTRPARYVAIKVFPAFFAEEEGFRERFQQEAIAIAKLRHPNILVVHDYGEENGITYIVGEFIEGGTLADQIGAPLPLDYVVRTLGPIAAALDYAHARGVLHRDVKPSNILLGNDGTPVLSDFGLARMVGSMPRLTRTGTTVGTPEYMAPEQGMGEEIGPSADNYALAVVAYELLTGRVPYSAETPLAVLLAHLHKPLPLPRLVNPALPAEVEEVLLKGLAKAPADRYPTASELINALSAAGRYDRCPPIDISSCSAAHLARAGIAGWHSRKPGCWGDKQPPTGAAIQPPGSGSTESLSAAPRRRPPIAWLAGIAVAVIAIVAVVVAITHNGSHPPVAAPATATIQKTAAVGMGGLHRRRLCFRRFRPRRSRRSSAQAVSRRLLAWPLRGVGSLGKAVFRAPPTP